MSTLTFRPFPARSGTQVRGQRDTAREETPAKKSRSGSPGARGRSSTKSLQMAAPGSYRAIWLVAVLLVVLGICMVLSVSMAQTPSRKAKRGPSATTGTFSSRVGSGSSCLALLLGVRRFDYRKLRKVANALMALTVVGLLLVHIPGVGSVRNGAMSYISLGPVSLQPSEFAKLAVIVVGAHILSSKRVKDGKIRSYLLPFGAWGLVLFGLLVWENDFGAAVIVIGLVMGMLWLAGMKTKDWLLLTGGGILAGGGAMLILQGGKVYARFMAVLDPGGDPTDGGYQLRQSLLALGRGGWMGVGPGRSVQKFNYLPEAHNDMIFAIVGEELGFLGASLVIGLFIVFAVASWSLARRCSDAMGKYLIAGCGMIVTLQAAVNIGGVIGVIPLTGVPLPFVSYGCNSLAVMLAAVGLIMAVAKRATPATSPSSANRSKDVARTDSRRGDGRARSARSSAS